MIRGEPRLARDSEVPGIMEALIRDSRFPVSDDDRSNGTEAPRADDILVTDNYISDGPGFAGSIAFIVWGEPQFVSILTRPPACDGPWTLINETTDEVQPRGAGCGDCGASAARDDVGTVCRECGRGIVKAIG